MSKLFEEMAQGLSEARTYMEGERKGYKVTLPDSIDFRIIRKKLPLGQDKLSPPSASSSMPSATENPAAAFPKPLPMPTYRYRQNPKPSLKS